MREMVRIVCAFACEEGGNFSATQRGVLPCAGLWQWRPFVLLDGLEERYLAEWSYIFYLIHV